MTRHWYIVEKIISIILIGLGTLNGYITYRYFDELYSLTTWEAISIPKAIKNLHFLVLFPIGAIIAGVLLLLNKKTGWLLSLILMTQSLVIVLVLFYWRRKNPEYTLLTAILSLLLVLLLTMRPFRLKYSVTYKNWAVIVSVSLILILDRLFIAFF